MIEYYINYSVYVLCVFILIYFLKDHIECFFGKHKVKIEGYLVEKTNMGDLYIIETKCTKCKCYTGKLLYRHYKLK